MVNPSEDGSGYEVIYSPDVRIRISKNGDGSFTVAESKGLFVYPKELMEIAIQTGAWDDNLNDVDQSKKAKEAYQNYLELMKKETESNVSINDFFKFSGGAIDFYKSPNAINSYLTSLGYVLTSSQTYIGDPDADNEPDTEDWITRYYSWNGITVTTVSRGEVSQPADMIVNAFSIKFKNKEQTNSFINNMKTSGWRKDLEHPYYYKYSGGYSGPQIYIVISGNTVDVQGNWE